MPLIAVNVPDLLPLNPPHLRDRDDLEEEINMLENFAAKLDDITGDMEVNEDLADLFSAAAMAEYDGDSGLDRLEAMRLIVKERVKELKNG